MDTMKKKELVEHIPLQSLKPGDLIIIRYEHRTADLDAALQLFRWLRSHGRDDVAVVELPAGLDLETISADELSHFGLQRIPKPQEVAAYKAGKPEDWRAVYKTPLVRPALVRPRS